MKMTLLIPVALMLALSVAIPSNAAVEKKPNLIVILTDDQGYEDLGCFGSYPIRIGEPRNIKQLHTVPHPKEVTMAEVLKSAGYATGIIGKWHLANKGKSAYGPYGDTIGSAGPLKGRKGSTFEGGMREPTVIRWPGVLPAGNRNDELMTTMDLLPTIAKRAGAKILLDRVIDGKDIAGNSRPAGFVNDPKPLSKSQ